MIYGAKKWKDGDFFSQENNPTEGLLKKFWKKVVTGYLETCGPTAACNCLAALGYYIKCECPGRYEIQPEEVLSDCMNDPRYEKQFAEVRKVYGLPGGRIAQWSPLAVKLVFGIDTAEFMWKHDFDYIARILSEGKAVQMQLKSPGHYIAAVAYDDETGEIIYKDSYVSRPGLKNHGNNERMTRGEYNKNVENFIVVYW